MAKKLAAIRKKHGLDENPAVDGDLALAPEPAEDDADVETPQPKESKKAKLAAVKPAASPEIFKNGKTLLEYWHRGFLLPALLYVDVSAVGTGRWKWWTDYWPLRVPDTPIPQIHWDFEPRAQSVVDQLHKCVDYECSIDEFLDFLLYGFGEESATSWQKVRPNTILKWEEVLHEVFPRMLTEPYCYFSLFLEQQMGKYRRGASAFYCTPLNVAQLMAQISYNGNDITDSVCDCCAGTGNLLLAASNFSINMFAQDIDAMVLKGLRLHAYMYMPWLVRPLPPEVISQYRKEKGLDKENVETNDTPAPGAQTNDGEKLHLSVLPEAPAGKKVRKDKVPANKPKKHKV